MDKISGTLERGLEALSSRIVRLYVLMLVMVGR